MEATPTRVFEAVSADYFSWAGRAYLVYADRLSGWPFVFHCNGETSARDLVSSLRLAFAATGAPSTLRTDSGSQFAARHTRDFLRRWGVTHQVSTPHFPQSSGHAVAAVKAVKRLVQKVCTRGDIGTDEFQKGLLELRNSPRADGLSPAQVLYGRSLRSAVPSAPPHVRRSLATCSRGVRREGGGQVADCRVLRPQRPFPPVPARQSTSPPAGSEDRTVGPDGDHRRTREPTRLPHPPAQRTNLLAEPPVPSPPAAAGHRVAVQQRHQQRQQLECSSRQQRRHWRHQARRQGSGPEEHQDRRQQHQHRRQRARRSSWWRLFCPRDPCEAKLASPSATEEAVGELV